ncbi:MAG: MoaD/ThiS family protein [Marmoricola sp.]
MSTPSDQDRPVRGQVTLRYWAAARAETGMAQEQVPVDGPVPLADLVAAALARHGGSERLRAVISSCSVLVGDRPVGSADPASVLVAPGESVEFLPPFAGG